MVPDRWRCDNLAGVIGRTLLKSQLLLDQGGYRISAGTTIAVFFASRIRTTTCNGEMAERLKALPC